MFYGNGELLAKKESKRSRLKQGLVHKCAYMGVASVPGWEIQAMRIRPKKMKKMVKITTGFNKYEQLLLPCSQWIRRVQRLVKCDFQKPLAFSQPAILIASFCDAR